MDKIVRYEHPGVVPIIDGKINFLIHEFNLDIIVYVRQIKGFGTADADNLTDLNHYHIDLLNMFLSSLDNINKVWTVNAILKKMEIIMHIEDSRYEFKQNNWRRPISEFLRRGILTHPEGAKHRYILDVEKAKKALTNGKFDKQTKIRA